VAKQDLETRPRLGNAWLEIHHLALQTQPKNALHAGALHPSG
jgi:hypothetical protein